MEHKKLALGFLVILLVAGLVGLLAFAPVASSARGNVPGTQKLTLALPGWQQVNSNGFGDPQPGDEVSVLTAFNGYLYAGTFNPINPAPGQLYDGAQIFRSPDGVSWSAVTQPGFGNTHDIAPPAILSMEIFNGYLYAGTGRGNASQLWRTSNGTTWAPMDVTGFSDPDNVDINALTEYGGKLYAGVTNQVSGAQIWSSFTGDNNNWTQVAPASPGTDVASVTAFAVFSDTLYAAVESAAPAQIWRSYGSDWTTIVNDGFGDADTTMTGGMAVFGGYLYVGAGNATSGAQLWRTNDETNWDQVITPAFGDSNNIAVESVFVFQNQLYASTRNASSGIEIWRSADGSAWEQVNQDGFGDSNNTGSNDNNATADFLGQLYVGTSNVVDGGELWRMQQQQTYGVNLSPDDAKSGAAGHDIAYTLSITNTGQMTDTIDIAVSGQTWTTTLSASQVNLAPAASTTFTITVAIPAGALGNDSDMATINATSQGDPAKSDSTSLTTTVLPSFGLTLSPDQAKNGLASQSITYTVWITNTGNVADTFNLALSGNSWSADLSQTSIALAAKAGAGFSVTVDIPAGAPDNATDAVTVTGTSQGDNGVTDAVVLTTKCVAPVGRIYLPFILQNP